MKPTGNDWLFNSVVAKLHKFMEVEELMRDLEKENIKEPLIRSMGGRYILITFKTTEVRDAIIKGNHLQRWFSEIKPWKGEVAMAERFVWLNCIGMLLHVWNLDSFRKIGEKWGAFMKVDESTLHCLSFTNGRVLVATEIMSTIEDSIQLDIDGILYKVKVREEPLAFGVEVRSRYGQNTSVDKEVSEGEMGVNVEDMVENSSNNGAEDVNGENKEAIVETDPRDDEPFDFDVDKAELENEMGIVGEVAETNVEVEKAIGVEERALQLINVSIQGCNDKATNSSSGVKASAWESGKTPRSSPSNLVDNQDSWVEDSVKENPVIVENLRGENDEDDNIPEHHIEAYRTENGPLPAPIKAVINGVKGKKKRKTIDDILGFTRVNSLNNKSRNNKPKCAVYRFAVAALALSASISSDGVTNRNRIILDEAEAI
ncbi:hypothetical protein RHMOL_Rhmol02G0111300 [Rhododendron molle]|uniref:Uncharacterized protein n=1 Tax=Rhododendron molle TaxID=49168 RepID=A0ACC0PNY3_RHOML|nr:hypothetical protein RHMOL_Rhmol02G0111300 [Rhododendron molle]